MVSDGTMKLEIGTWVNIKKGKIKMENKIKKYIVMSKFDHSDKFIMERGFSTRKDANTYAKLMMDSKDYDHIQYYCFEQTMDYNFYYDVNLEKKDNIDDDGIPF